MFSGEDRFCDEDRFSGHGGRSHSGDRTLRSETIQVERKTFIFTLKENPRGRFLRITEDVNGRRDSIILPAPGLADFKRVVDRMLDTYDSLPD